MSPTLPLPLPDSSSAPEYYPPPAANPDRTTTLYPPPPQFIDSDGTLDSIYIQIRGPDNTYENLSSREATSGVDPSTGEPIYQNMSPLRNPRHSTDSGVPSSEDSGVAPSISSFPPAIPAPTPANHRSGADYTNNLIIPRKYRHPSYTTLSRIPSLYSEHPTSCYTPALHATRRALRKVRQNFSKRKSRSGESSGKKSGNEYDDYVIPESNLAPVQTYVLNDFVFSRL
ncbi:hypothetical protein ACHWQZ_G007646 [Mnemiopsis leidyi]